MSQDPYPNDRPSSSYPDQHDGGPSGRQTGYQQYPPYQPHRQYPPYQPHQQYQPYQPGLYQPGMYALSARTVEGERAAQLSLVLGIVGFFVAGLILGPLAIWQAKKAEDLGVPATVGKVLGWILTVLYGGLLLLAILLVIVLFAGLGAAGSYSS